MNIRLLYRQWWRERKYKKVVAGIDKLNKMADDIAKSIPHEFNLVSLLSLMVTMMVSVQILKMIENASIMSMHVFRIIRKRSHLFFWG